MNSEHEQPDSDRPDKRQRVEEQPQQPGEGEGLPAPPPAHDQVTTALAKIANHISSAGKFSKASALLRQIMDAVDKPHRNEYFHAVQCAFAQPEHCIEPLLRKDYMRLMKAVNIRADVLSKQQRAQLEVFSTWALLRNELFTDDSFVFNKVVAKIKAAIAELSDGDLQQELTWGLLNSKPQPATAAIAAGAAAAEEGPSSTQQEQQQQQWQQQQQQGVGRGAAAAAASPAAPTAAEDESDPFGLNDFIAKAEAQAAQAAAAAAGTQPQQQPHSREPPQQPDKPASAIGAAGDAATSAAAVPSSSAAPETPGAAQNPQNPAAHAQTLGQAWDPVSLEVMKKQALLDCLVAAKTHQHKLAWARASIEILIEEVAKPSVQGGFADKFVGGQKQQLQDLLKFVNAERAARKSGVNRRPGGKGTGDYTTSFERARAEWSSASWVSTRGKVGSQGDSKTQNWLG